ncbi:hypothetical protein TD95_004049 [Thielaviopsis punctulata]|uniref:L-2,4-diaminobutyrate decarboxylase n=1 Tax=Thielaviopsis punctulata TaxID=72032 RepID=A0A0F4ZEJ2_9PEZI|nr:hypothetical protein TD95_004049 [Thielaviopsis punctulata]
MSKINLEEEYALLRRAVEKHAIPLSPSSSAAASPHPANIDRARSSLPKPDDADYLSPLGATRTLQHIREDILPGLSGQAVSSRFFGFVTGGVHPVGEAADNIVAALDQNVSSYLPENSVAVDVEMAALDMLARVLRIDGPRWEGGIFTTGATASNVLGLACGRDAVIARRLQGETVAELGVLKACVRAGVSEMQVLTSGAHSSLAKAAAVVGLGWEAVQEVGVSDEMPWKLDIDEVERRLQRPGVASIISVSMGEVNTGFFATNGLEDMQRLRRLADEYGAWLHVDGAFGIFVRALTDSSAHASLKKATEGLELADSITADAHKVLNTPYDCGIFYCAHRSVMNQTFRNPNAAYLTVPPGQIPSPLDIGLENSRRFRALPVYAILRSLGQTGIAKTVDTMVAVTRALARGIAQMSEYEILPPGVMHDDEFTSVSFILMIRLRDDEKNKTLVEKINGSREMFVSGSQWAGKKAARIAVSSHMTQMEDVAPVLALLKGVAM